MSEVKDNVMKLNHQGTDYSLFYAQQDDANAPVTLDKLPYSIRILLENVLRNAAFDKVDKKYIKTVRHWHPTNTERPEIPFLPSRILLQDFTGVPAVVDLAAMRDTVIEWGGKAEEINPVIPVDLVIDHSVQIDKFGSTQALDQNMTIEFERNQERYRFLKWGQNAFENFRVVPPGMGIVHQVNLEYLASVVATRQENDQTLAFPDTLIGTDSHTTMINGIGVLGWGVGGIEAEAAMLGQPVYMLLPQVVGFRLTGKLPEGATATDLVLTVTNMLRSKGVVGKFVEFCGDGYASLSLADRATLANMAPEYGATMGFCPVDQETLNYLRLTGREESHIDFVKKSLQALNLFREESAPEPTFSDLLELNMNEVVATIAGPKRPQDKIALTDAAKKFKEALTTKIGPAGFGITKNEVTRKVPFELNGQKGELTHGSLLIAAITSCTNTSNPAVVLAAGLVAKKAVELGLKVPHYVKTSLAPGSRVVTDYLIKSGLLPYLEKLGFHIVGYGCTTCIGNSGPIAPELESAINEGNLVAGSVLSGNRNFEGRIHPMSRANFLASPPLVIAYALAGRLDIDFSNDSLGCDQNEKPVYLKDVWPATEEINQLMGTVITAQMFKERYATVFAGDERWQSQETPTGETYAWEADSTYIRRPTFLANLPKKIGSVTDINQARVLVKVANSVTTDHISPAGAIPYDSPAAQWLTENGVETKDFNSFGSRRGNHEVMMRGTFGNIRLKNQLVPGSEGNITRNHLTGEDVSIFDASLAYQEKNIPLLVLAGQEYGTGSSRDWAAKGTLLLGVRAVIAESYERIHRSNLAGMGILPLQYKSGDTADSLGLTGKEEFRIAGITSELTPGQDVTVVATSANGLEKSFVVSLRLDTAMDIDYYKNGGILPAVLREQSK